MIKLPCQILILFTAISAVSTVSGQDNLPPVKKEDLHLFLLAGQSNMAGRGTVESQDQKAHPRVYVLTKEKTWKPAVDPLHFEKSEHKYA